MKNTILIYSSICCLFSGVLHAGWGQKLCVEANGATTEFTLGTIDSLVFTGKGDSLKLVCDSITKNWFLHAIGKIGFEEDSAETYKSVIIELDSGSISYNLKDITGIAFEPEILDSGDWDGDKLLNDDEIKKYGTDPRSKDTDGDGFDDYEEAHKGSGREWHPLIADLPRIALEMKGYPDIDFIEERGKTSSRTKTVEKGEEIENSSTQSESYGSSFTMEHGWKVEAEVGYGITPDKWSGKVTVGVHGSYTQGTTTEYGSSRTSGYEQSFNQALSEMEDSSWNATGGVIAVPFAVKNTGSIGYTVENLIISCYTIDYSSREGFVGTGCALYPDTRFAVFQPFTLPPGDRKEPQWFLNDNLTLELTRELACQGEALVCEITGCLLSYTDEEGKKTDFTSVMTNVPARTADILVDFGPGKGKDPLRYRVATLYKYNPEHKSLTDIYHAATLQDILQTLDLDYEMGTSNGKSGIVSLDGVAQETDLNGCWFIAHRKRDSKSYAFYSMQQDGYKPEEINIRVNDRVEIIYSVDRDYDGISLRTEKLIGTDDTKTDTDGDGLTDFEEITGWVRSGDTLRSDPKRVDSDGDGIPDPDDPKPLERRLGSSATVTKVSIVGSDGSMFERDSLEPGFLNDAAVVHSSTAAITVETKDYLVCTVTRSDSRRDSLKLVSNGPPTYSADVVLLFPRDSLVVRTVSEDGTDSARYVIPVNTGLADIDPGKISVTRPLDVTKSNTECRAVVNLSEPRDKRAEGMVVLLGTDKAKMQAPLAPQDNLGNLKTIDSLDYIHNYFTVPFETGTADITGLEASTTYYLKFCIYRQHSDGKYYFSPGNELKQYTTKVIGHKISVTVTHIKIYIQETWDEEDDGGGLEMEAGSDLEKPGETTFERLSILDASGSHNGMGWAYEFSAETKVTFTLAPDQHFRLKIILKDDDGGGDDWFCTEATDTWTFHYYDPEGHDPAEWNDVPTDKNLTSPEHTGFNLLSPDNNPDLLTFDRLRQLPSNFEDQSIVGSTFTITYEPAP
ncbi:MAG: hypothetical protein JW913_04815 [Chitinispirillaceae bacterium]|nr:hypothetical protein [Chitinispirillaceae bacterium]